MKSIHRTSDQVVKPLEFKYILISLKLEVYGIKWPLAFETNFYANLLPFQDVVSKPTTTYRHDAFNSHLAFHLARTFCRISSPSRCQFLGPKSLSISGPPVAVNFWASLINVPLSTLLQVWQFFLQSTELHEIRPYLIFYLNPALMISPGFSLFPTFSASHSSDATVGSS